MVRPSALAVLRLMTNSNVVGCSTGRSPGLAPLRICPDSGSPSRHLREIDSIATETAVLNVQVVLIDGGDPVRGRKIEDGLSMHEHKGGRHHHYSLVVILFHAEESGGQVLRSAHINV